MYLRKKYIDMVIYTKEKSHIDQFVVFSCVTNIVFAWCAMKV